MPPWTPKKNGHNRIGCAQIVPVKLKKLQIKSNTAKTALETIKIFNLL